MVSKGRFREDLLYRINTIIIEVPPLRDHVFDDIPILANYFLRLYCEKYEKKPMKINSGALSKLSITCGPVMLENFQHAIGKAVIMTDSQFLSRQILSLNTQKRIFQRRADP